VWWPPVDEALSPLKSTSPVWTACVLAVVVAVAVAVVVSKV
jgi:hypothetical protein